MISIRTLQNAWHEVAFLSANADADRLSFHRNATFLIVFAGAKYKNQCPVEEKIPIYLAVAGAVGGFRILIALGQMAKESGNQDEEEQKWKRLLDFILYCFLFVWFICGNVWIYQNYEPNYLEVRDPGYCHKTLYLFAFWITTATYILVGLYCCCGCGMCIWFTATGMLDNFPSWAVFFFFCKKKKTLACRVCYGRVTGWVSERSMTAANLYLLSLRVASLTPL